MFQYTLLFVMLCSTALAGGKGIGVVSFAENGTRTDSAMIFEHPSAASRVLAVHRITVTKHGYEYSVTHPQQTAIVGLVEYGYELSGIPIRTIHPSRQWVQVTVAYPALDSVVQGWISIEDNSMVIREWKDELPLQSGLFFDPLPAADMFYDEAEGRIVPFALSRTEHIPNGLIADYIMYPLEVRGTWMKVRVVTPGDLCSEPGPHRSAVLWIRFLNDQGEPLVFYHTRGC